MKKILVTALFLLCVHIVSAQPDSVNRYFIKASNRAKVSVVTVLVYNSSLQGRRQVLRRTAVGSGTILSKNGLVVTNRHVLTRGNYFRIIDHAGREYDIQYFSGKKAFLDDPKTDIAVLRIYNPENVVFKPLQLSDSNNLLEGEWVLAIGNPYGLRLSITSGIVSSTGRDNIGFVSIEDFIQTDVPINPGNSGGPLVNLYGKMVGLNTAIQSNTGAYQGISFSIPSNIVRHVVTDLVTHGRVRRGWIGFLATEKFTRRSSMISVLSVLKNSPAQEAGLRKNDIIRAVNGKRITSLGSLMKMIGNKQVGSRISITVSRQGRLKKVFLVLREKKTYRKMKTLRYRLLGRYGFEIDEFAHSSDVIISYVTPGTYSSGLKPADIIVKINGQEITGVDSFIHLLSKYNYNLSSITVRRKGRHYWIRFQ